MLHGKFFVIWEEEGCLAHCSVRQVTPLPPCDDFRMSRIHVAGSLRLTLEQCVPTRQCTAAAKSDRTPPAHAAEYLVYMMSRRGEKEQEQEQDDEGTEEGTEDEEEEREQEEEEEEEEEGGGAGGRGGIHGARGG